MNEQDKNIHPENATNEEPIQAVGEPQDVSLDFSQFDEAAVETEASPLTLLE